jgi:ribosome-associated protein
MTDAAVTAAAEAARTLAVVAARAADDKKAEHTLILSVGDVLAITDYFVITSASNRRLVKSVVDAVEDAVREQLGRSPLRVEGAGEQQWVLVDYGDVVVHVFAEEIRMYYEIERLYRDVAKVDWTA